MSAHSQDRPGQIIPFSGTEPLIDHLPSLPQIGNDLESYFVAARHIEAALLQERGNLRKTRDELREFQVKYTRLTSETEGRLREGMAREERLHSQIQSYQQTEKSLRDQLEASFKQVDLLKEDKKKLDLQIELLKANLSYFREREESVKEIINAKQELDRYKAAWSRVVAMDHQARKTLKDSEKLQKSLAELTGVLQQERRRCEILEESLTKEKREKQAALTCLHSAEAKLNQVQRSLEHLQNQNEKNFTDPELELKF